jgi:hypothetical protein
MIGVMVIKSEMWFFIIKTQVIFYTSNKNWVRVQNKLQTFIGYE